MAKGVQEFKHLDLKNKVGYNISNTKGDILKIGIKGFEVKILSDERSNLC